MDANVYIIEKTKLDAIVFPEVDGFKIDAYDFTRQVTRNGVEYAACCTAEQFMPADLSSFMVKSIADFNAWVASYPADIANVRYNWTTNKVVITLTNGRVYSYDNPGGSDWNAAKCQEVIAGETFDNDSVLVLPIDLCIAMQSQYSKVKAILADDCFIYPTKTVDDKMQSYVQLCPILFETIDEGDAEAIELIRLAWNNDTLNVDRQLNCQLLFPDGFSYFNCFKKNILS